MQKPQRKNLNKWQKKGNKTLRRGRKRSLGLKLYGRPFFNKFLRIKKHNFLTFNVYPNNVFCTYKKFQKIKRESKFVSLNTASSGKYKIKISKKTLRYKLKFVIAAFFKELSQKNLVLSNNVAVKLIAPIKLKKTIIKMLSHQLKRKNFMIETVGKKVFNGCRARKQIRKKRKGLRLYK